MWARQPFMLAVDHNFWQVVTLALMPIQVQEVLVTPFMGTGTNATEGVRCRDLVQNDQIRFRQAQSGVNDRALETAGVYGTYEGGEGWARPKNARFLTIYADRDIEEQDLVWYEIRLVVIAIGAGPPKSGRGTTAVHSNSYSTTWNSSRRPLWACSGVTCSRSRPRIETCE